MFKTLEHTLSADVATSGTFTVAYPTGTNAGSFSSGVDNKMIAIGANFEQPAGFTLSFGTSSITVTYKGATTIPAGSLVRLQLDMGGDDDETQLIAENEEGEAVFIPDTVSVSTLARINLGAPDAADPDGVCASQSDTGAHTLTLDGALVSGGVATFDVPRNVVVDSGGADTATLTITGTDEYGEVVVENIQLNGTTAVAGKKAFKTITSVTSDGTIANGAFVGTGDVLGLPVYLADAGAVLAELEDGAAASAGTLVGGLSPNTASTATTADVRGTYDPNSACDGAKAFTLIAAIADASYLGNAQFTG